MSKNEIQKRFTEQETLEDLTNRSLNQLNSLKIQEGFIQKRLAKSKKDKNSNIGRELADVQADIKKYADFVEYLKGLKKKEVKK